MTSTGEVPVPEAPTPGQPAPGRCDAQDLGRALQRVLEGAARQLDEGAGASATSRRISEHLGTELRRAVLITTDVPQWQHVSVQRAVTAYLAEHHDDADWFGVISPHFGHVELRSLLLQESGSGSDEIVPPDYTTAADGPASQVEVISFGLVRSHSPAGAPVVIVVNRNQMHGPPQLDVVVIAADRADATPTVERLRALIEEHDVIRGQVVSFGTSEHYGNALVTFLPRPALTADQVILDPSVLPRIERHLLLTGQYADRLRASGLHLKRGVLLYGPPGTGKTHTVRYLISQATGSTVIVLTGRSLQFIEQAASLARRVAPTIVVVEDVDLIGQDRSFSPDGNPLLFSLLDAMDGVASDADVSFVLTTNRPADLEEALVQRPGRIDLAVEVPHPDQDARRELLALYSGTATVTADLGPAIEQTAGMTASALKELMRRAVLEAVIAATDTAAPPVVTDEILADTLQRYICDRAELARALSDPGREGGSGEDGDGGTFDGVSSSGQRPMSSARRSFRARGR